MKPLYIVTTVITRPDGSKAVAQVQVMRLSWAEVEAMVKAERERDTTLGGLIAGRTLPTALRFRRVTVEDDKSFPVN